MWLVMWYVCNMMFLIKTEPSLYHPLLHLEMWVGKSRDVLEPFIFRRLSMSTTSRKLHRSKAEATLTVTMFIIMIPAFFAQILSIGSLTGWKYYSYILVARPILIDSRVNIVSCYFYLTHPIFKQEPNSTVTVRSLNTTTY
ncbi:unnamed protein product [Caenorhabditis nigoni]